MLHKDLPRAEANYFISRLFPKSDGLVMPSIKEKTGTIRCPVIHGEQLLMARGR
jgi:hypothetical protein